MASSRSSSSKNTLSLPTNVTSTGSATGNPRNKTALQPGCSLMDWVALMNSGKDLSGTGGKMRKVSMEELKKHGPEDKEPWIALRNHVYNISQYKRFHPGGVDELLRGAGKDATKLFNEVHPWVHFEMMLSKCIIGKLEQKTILPVIPAKKPGFFQIFREAFTCYEVDVEEVPTLLPPPVPPIPTLKSDFYQSDSRIVINIYVKRPHLSENQVVIEAMDSSPLNEIRIFVLNFENDFIECVYSLGDFENQSWDYEVKISPQGKIEISFLKSKPERASIKMISIKRKPRFEDSILRSWTLVSKERVTHDVFEFKFKKPSHLLHFQIPIGHHVPLSLNSIQKMYTPISGGHDTDGCLMFLIKIYEDGAFTPLLHSLDLGDHIQIGNPRGSFQIPNVEKRVRLFAGGTGFTPMTRLIEHYLSLSKDVQLYFFNKTRKDIIYRERIEEWSKGNLSVVHILSQDSDAEAPFLHGRISKKLLVDLLDEEMERSCEQIFICGPSSFTQETFRLLTEHLSYSSRNVVKFGG